MPTLFENSAGAAPVPPSAPSTVMKSGNIFCSTIAATIDENSSGRPTQSLNPIGFPSDNSLNCSINFKRPYESEKVE